MCYITVQIQSRVSGSSARSGFGPAFSHYACHKTSEVITPHSTMNANKINQWLMKNFILKHQLSQLGFHGYSGINCFHTDLTLFCQKLAPLLFTKIVFVPMLFLFPSFSFFSWSPSPIIYLHLERLDKRNPACHIAFPKPSHWQIRPRSWCFKN